MKILIVDDSPNWVRFHKNNLEYLGYEPDSANSAANALYEIELSLNEPYDAIFTDLQMENNYAPKLAGEWLIEQIQTFTEYKNVKITIISASPSIKFIAEKYNVNYIPKSEIINSDAEIYKKFL